MCKVVLVSDAHLLIQAEWVDEEDKLSSFGEKVLEEFKMVTELIIRQNPDIIIMAGDMFDYKMKSGHKIAFREGEKYMLRIEEVIGKMLDETGSEIYAIKGNHDSAPTLRRLQLKFRGKFHYIKNEARELLGYKFYFMDTHYKPYSYSINQDIEVCDYLVIHEQIPIDNMPGVSRDFLEYATKRCKLIFNGHMHRFERGVLGFNNIILLPALIPSQETKNAWTIKYELDPSNETFNENKRDSPFGFVVFNPDSNKCEYIRYTPDLRYVLINLIGGDQFKYGEYLNGLFNQLREYYRDYDRLLVWIETDADRIICQRKIKEVINQYPEIRVLEVKRVVRRIPSLVEKDKITDKASGKVYTWLDLINRLKEEKSFSPRQIEIIEWMFDNILSRDRLRLKSPHLLNEFVELISKVAEEYDISNEFTHYIKELSKKR